ncbi:unknown [Bacteroides sp. CAG:1060]|nr:unknown [Bacteroides sp. CAG:1060]
MKPPRPAYPALPGAERRKHRNNREKVRSIVQILLKSFQRGFSDAQFTIFHLRHNRSGLHKHIKNRNVRLKRFGIQAFYAYGAEDSTGDKKIGRCTPVSLYREIGRLIALIPLYLKFNGTACRPIVVFQQGGISLHFASCKHTEMLQNVQCDIHIRNTLRFVDHQFGIFVT